MLKWTVFFFKDSGQTGLVVRTDCECVIRPLLEFKYMRGVLNYTGPSFRKILTGLSGQTGLEVERDRKITKKGFYGLPYTDIVFNILYFHWKGSLCKNDTCI